MELLAKGIAGIRACEADQDALQKAEQFLEQWLTQSAFAEYVPQIQWLIEEEKWSALLDRFYQILPFGTGGRRGAVGIGPNRMNLWTLGASVQGHAEYLRERFPGVERLSVVVAYDVRQFEDKNNNYNPDLPNPTLHLSSKDFARHAVRIYAANGIHSYILPENSTRYLATPELSFAIRRLQAHGGLNISASHNPPDDNGGKFYDERGAQPIAPEDQIMAELVDQVETIKSLDWTEALKTGRVHEITESIHKSYIELCRKQSLLPTPKFDEVRIVFSPLHGVGAMTAMETLEDAGFRMYPVEDQMTPDGQFPNVTKSPNPEVPASLDRAEELAKKVEADLLLATDPDADRLGGMSPRTSDRKGPWRYLNGNEIGAMLTYFKLDQLAEKGMLPKSPVVVKTLVTTNMVTRIARHFGAQIVDNLLVGCKYIGDVIWQLEANNAFQDVEGTPDDFVIGVEESHGYLLTPEIRDKDAASSALVLAEIALLAKRNGLTVADYLDDLTRKFGYFRNVLATVVMKGLEGKQQMAKMLDTMRQSPPTEIGGLPVTQFDDLRSTDSWMGEFKGATDYKARNFLVFTLGAEARIALRPSGTEPKAKAYIEVCCQPSAADTPESEWLQTCQRVDDTAEKLETEFVRYALGLVGLKPPEEQ
ncbi:MAG: phospho-sugar mutase [Gemmataceae bacterium]